MSDQLEVFEELLPFAKRALAENVALVRGLKLQIGRPSSWEGRSIGRYVEQGHEEVTISRPFPADLTTGRLINPTTNLFDGSSPVRANVVGVVAIAVTIVGRSWVAPEIQFRHYFHQWARRIKGPVFVNLAHKTQPWSSTFWLFTSGTCSRHGSFSGECDTRSVG